MFLLRGPVVDQCDEETGTELEDLGMIPVMNLKYYVGGLEDLEMDLGMSLEALGVGQMGPGLSLVQRLSGVPGELHSVKHHDVGSLAQEHYLALLVEAAQILFHYHQVQYFLFQIQVTKYFLGRHLNHLKEHLL